MPHSKEYRKRQHKYRDAKRNEEKWRDILFEKSDILLRRIEALRDKLDITAADVYTSTRRFHLSLKGDIYKAVHYEDHDLCYNEDILTLWIFTKGVKIYCPVIPFGSFNDLGKLEEKIHMRQLMFGWPVRDKDSKFILKLFREWIVEVVGMTLGERNMSKMKEDIIAAVFKPSRVEKWIESGVDLDNI